MGAFYVNFAAFGVSQESVANSLRAANREAYVGPTIQKATFFFDRVSSTQDTDAILEVGRQVSRELKAPVLAVLNHDDDVLWYWLFQDGELIDDYSSCPEYFDTPPTFEPGGDAKKLCALIGVPSKQSEVHRILHDEEYVFAMDRHRELAAALGHGSQWVHCDYETIDQGGLTEEMQAESIVQVGDDG